MNLLIFHLWPTLKDKVWVKELNDQLFLLLHHCNVISFLLLCPVLLLLSCVSFISHLFTRINIFPFPPIPPQSPFNLTLCQPFLSDPRAQRQVDPRFLAGLKISSACSSLSVFRVTSKDKMIDKNPSLRKSTGSDISFNSTNIF